MTDPGIRLEAILQRLQQNAYRVTPQRLAILKILVESNSHPSVENIYEQVKLNFPTTSLATVYKNVSILKDLGEVPELEFSNDRNRYDGNRPQPHPHLICSRCKKIVDPDLASLEDVTAELTQETGFKILNHRLDFFGICPGCQKK